MCPVLPDPVARPWTNFYPPVYEGTFTSHGAVGLCALGLAQLDFTVGGLKSISEGHLFQYAGAPYKCLYGGAP